MFCSKGIVKIVISFISIVSGIEAYAQENILLIISDDIGIDYTSGYNSAIDTAPTPNIDSLARQGMLFENAWATPFCSPTRATILTGRYAFRTGVGAPVGGPGRPGLPIGEETIPLIIKQFSPYDYSTACIGKWHLSTNKNGGNQHPSIAGFDFYSGNTGGDVGDYYAWQKITNGVTDSVYTYATTETVNDAINYIDTVSNPWFIWLAFNASHTPYHKPPDSLHSYNHIPDIPTGSNVADHLRAMTEALDAETGRLFKFMKNKGVYDNTHIIYMGDNGTPKKAILSPFQKEQGKATLYNNGTQVPLIIKSNLVSQPFTRCNKIVEASDIFATVLEFAGITNLSNLTNTIDSKSLIPLLGGSSTFHKQWVFAQTINHDVQEDGVSIRNQDYHLIRTENQTDKLFKVSEDIYETNDLLSTSLDTEAQDNYDELTRILDSLMLTTNILSLKAEDNNDCNISTFKNTLKIEHNGNWNGAIVSIFNITGKKILSRSINAQTTLIPKIRNTPQSVIVHISDGENFKVEKMIF